MKLINKIIFYSYSALFFFVPLVFTIWNFELFEFNKIVLVYLFTTVILSAWIGKMILLKKFVFKRTFWDIPLILFLFSQIISTIFSIDPQTSIFGYYSRFNGGLLSTLCYSILFWCLVSNLDKSQAKKLIKISLISGLIVSFYGIGQRLGIDKNFWVQDVQSRIFSTLGQPNWLAAYLNILIFLIVGTNLKLSLPISYFLFSIFYTTLLFTRSRSGFLGFIIPFGFWIGINIFLSLKNKKIKELKTTGLIVLIFLTISFIIGLPFSIQDQLNISFLSDVPQSQLVTPDPSTDLHITPSSDIRKIVWQGAVDLWKENPIIGTGVETFGYSYYWTRSIEHNLTSEWDFLYNKAHNEFLNFAANSGTLGLIAYLILIVTALIFAIKNYQFFLLYILISISITNFFGFSVVTMSFFFFLLPGIAFLETKNVTKKPNKPYHSNRNPIYLLPAIIFFIILTSLIVRYWLGDFYYAKGKQYAQAGFLNSANNYLSKASSLNPIEPNYYSQRSIVYAKLTAYYVQEGSKQEAEKYFQPAINNSSLAIEISPYHLNFYKNKVRAYYYLALYDLSLLENAIRLLEKAERLAPTDPKIPFNLGQIYQTLDEKEKAEEYYQKAVDLKPNYQLAVEALESL